MSIVHVQPLLFRTWGMVWSSHLEFLLTVWYHMMFSSAHTRVVAKHVCLTSSLYTLDGWHVGNLLCIPICPSEWCSNLATCRLFWDLPMSSFLPASTAEILMPYTMVFIIIWHQMRHKVCQLPNPGLLYMTKLIGYIKFHILTWHQMSREHHLG